MTTKHISIIVLTIYLLGFLAGRATAGEAKYDLNTTTRGNQQLAIETVNYQSMNWADDTPAKPTESVDQYLDRMRMRRDDLHYQACIEKMKMSLVDSTETKQVSACVPPDYSVKEFQNYKEWNGTVAGGVE
jgi:hypothetical protein